MSCNELTDSENGNEFDHSETGGVSVFDMPIRPWLCDLEGWRRDHPVTTKLYQAWSLFESSKYGIMKMYWYVEKRDDNVVMPYEAFIYGYDSEMGEVIFKKLRLDIAEILREGKCHPLYGSLGFSDSEENQAYSMIAIDDCFTEKEIEQFKEYFKDDENLHIEEVDPLFNNIGLTSFYIDFAHDIWYDMTREPGYNLPFEVNGVIYRY